MKARFSLENARKKYICPDCGKKTYVRFIDWEGNHLPEKYGRCDREVNCAYFLSPYHDGYAKGTIDYNYEIQKRLPEPVKPTSFVNPEFVLSSFVNYYDNSLIKYLSKWFSIPKLQSRFKLYHTGIDQSSPYTRDYVIFWQTDIDGKIRSGKFIKYTDSGKRCKETKASWYHKTERNGEVIYPDFNYVQCFFGEHLLRTDYKKPIGIVESEKTAIIASLFMDKYIWLASGSMSNLNEDKCKVLNNRNVTLFPDLGGYDYWSKKALEFGFSVSYHLEKIATEEDRKQGLDLADYLLR